MSWTDSGAQITPKIKSFLDQLSSITDVPIHVTSGFRGPEKQVEVVCDNTIRENEKNLVVYKDPKERELYRAECKPGGDRKKIVDYLKNKTPKSHGTGASFDIRIKNLSESQITTLIEKIESIGGKTVREYSPPHIHVDIISQKSSLTSTVNTGTLSLGAISVESAIRNIFEDSPECPITAEHIRKVESMISSDSFLEGILGFLLEFFGLGKFDINVKSMIQKIIANSSSEDKEDLISFILEKNPEELFEGLCIPNLKRTKANTVQEDVKNLEFKERYDEKYVNAFYSALQHKESRGNPKAFGKDGEISTVQIMFFNAIHWFGEEKVFKAVALEKGPAKEQRLREIYNKYRSRKGRTRDESVEAGTILSGISLYDEENIRKVCIEKIREYFKDSEDFFEVACKWNTGKAEEPCSRNPDYPKDVLSNMLSVLNKTANVNSNIIKKVALSSAKILTKISFEEDLKGNRNISNDMDITLERLFRMI